MSLVKFLQQYRGGSYHTFDVPTSIGDRAKDIGALCKSRIGYFDEFAEQEMQTETSQYARVHMKSEDGRDFMFTCFVEGDETSTTIQDEFDGFSVDFDGKTKVMTECKVGIYGYKDS